MLDLVRSSFIGNTVVNATVTGDVLDIGRRLNEGDATLGWEGDPTLSLHLAVEVDPVSGDPIPGGTHRFEVWGLDARNEPYMALSWPRCDASLIKRIVEIDGRRQNVIDRVVAENETRRRDIERQRRDQQAETVDRLAHALRKDVGHLYGGLRREFYPV